MISVADRAVELRDEVLSLWNEVARGKQIALINQSATDVVHVASHARQVWQVLGLLDVSHRPAMTLPKASEVAELRKTAASETGLTFRAAAQLAAVLGQYLTQLRAAESQLRFALDSSTRLLTSTIENEAQTADAGFQLDLASRLRNLKTRLSTQLGAVPPALVAIIGLLEEHRQLENELQTASQSGSDETRAFLSKVGTSEGASLAGLDPQVLEELKKDGRAESLKVRAR